METVKKTIELDAYVDDEGRPCCAKSFPDGEICPFLMTRDLGQTEECYFGDRIERRGDNGRGTLIPVKECPIWSKENG